MPTVAQQLKSAREAKGLTIHQVAEVTKIRTDHIRALEEGNFNVFSATVYIRGFVRAYATLLKLDVRQVMLNLDGELSQNDKFKEPPPLVPQSGGIVNFITLQLSKLNWRVTAVLGAIALIGLGIWSYTTISRHRKAYDPLANLAPAAYQPAPGGATLPIPSNIPASRHP